MASIVHQAGGLRMIQFHNASGDRKTIRLGKMSLRSAEAVKYRVEQLVSASVAGTTPDDETTRWLGNLDTVMLGKLTCTGLIAAREQVRLAAFLDNYIGSRKDTKPATQLVYGHTRRNLVAFFGADKLLRDITPGDADEWRIDLIRQRLADNTVRRRCGIAKQFFHAAHRKDFVQTNPFVGLKCTVRANTDRMYFVTQAQAAAVLDACPDAQWRLLFALSRYGGLRCPSEHLRLRWCDVDWERNRMTVHSPKTEHHLGGASRLVPLFPELLPHLREVFEQASPGDIYVITRYRQLNSNLRTHLCPGSSA